MATMHHRSVTSHMRQRARTLRREAPVPERVLWGLLRGQRLGGLRFRRQETLGPFVVDFVCYDRKLIVELDGESHVGRGAQDEGREAVLQKMGFNIVRVTNDDLLGHPAAVAESIARAAGLNW
jgi:very-short-patch-repair endonuclease